MGLCNHVDLASGNLIFLVRKLVLPEDPSVMTPSPVMCGGVFSPLPAFVTQASRHHWWMHWVETLQVNQLARDIGFYAALEQDKCACFFCRVQLTQSVPAIMRAMALPVAFTSCQISYSKAIPPPLPPPPPPHPPASRHPPCPHRHPRTS